MRTAPRCKGYIALSASPAPWPSHPGRGIPGVGASSGLSFFRPSWFTATSLSRTLKRAPRCSAHLLPPVSLDGCGRAARRDAAGVARGRCGAAEEGASLGGERREEAPGRSRGCQLRPSRASALCRSAGSQPCGPVGRRERGPPAPPLPAGTTGWVFTRPLPPATPGVALSIPCGLGDHGKPS